MTLVYVGLGANLGNRIVTINAAEGRLADLPGVAVLRRASLWRTAPVGVLEQPEFINTVVELSTEADPSDLLKWFKMIEVELGRIPAERWSARVIDLDLLLYGGLELQTPELTIPHVEMWKRLFVLAPLMELRPDLKSPDERGISDVCFDLTATQTVDRIDGSSYG